MTATFSKDELTEILPALHRFALSLTRNQERAEDLVQDSVERALRKASYYQPGTNFRSWMFTLCRRLFLNQIRKQKTQGVHVDIDDSPQSTFAAAPSQESACEYREVMEQFEKLPERDQDLISLVAVDGMKYADAARKMKTPVGTIRSRLSRARTRLKDMSTAAPRKTMAKAA
ncbi:sigma-70 family RNA polymerase sigma factor [Hyphococcus flavus]|uniref:Sigma-70 family RNA polymerase sigma factor n=1 Tax=Hyphococcus flavus TaxID=1866326 RepID=A0AAF0CBI7_9PROT|nr:sigma-70 family RNA polymerase sigma factor [Hyphococcus flavus]WDI31060.1 sigma-70 family RNA polymerase sigma factor [Hyphococcus flavus]